MANDTYCGRHDRIPLTRGSLEAMEPQNFWTPIMPNTDREDQALRLRCLELALGVPGVDVIEHAEQFYTFVAEAKAKTLADRLSAAVADVEAALSKAG